MLKGPLSRSRFFNVYAVANRLQYARLGMAVSRKVSLRAVERNRIKRLIRDFFRHHQKGLVGRDIVVVVKAAAANQAHTELRDSLSKDLGRAAELCSIY
ncbi:MAG: hypothetical protein BMS9Abin36_1043 [Gammaproteobacteria bacterium]|nr:MAG: hypothetical protein BMS9Abin36_1043 [Gammaproteobacteria bacterium]